MSTLVVTAHPDPTSLTHHVAARLCERLTDRGEDVTTAHLAQEGFDPRFTATDRQAYLTGQGHPRDVLAEQERLDAAQHLVLVFPVYWWSMPALLKGWVDRVFVAPWAFAIDDGGRVVPAQQRLTVHLVPILGTAQGSFARHGYAESFTTQVERGILDYCGVRRGATAFVHDAEDETRATGNAGLAVDTVVGAVVGTAVRG
ncbi:NAD(P)H dehydrogenase (quinone) [Nocardioides zeae]|uniref:NAD(P)H dehydrogenase (Quinone) n=1 Tax=Nocardioides zeae TaxID=1457234 RepID=A0ACC6IFA5_9ACTN|nr:NAD(P)H-dependent oxidoreductase [Nocardioides zeae]MDR6176383.1 NAD(P)H dehydrogenase (quinone) [Nocardioides zeae]MDR6209396.1 NAD(P)H dehydrogenase (quinone) [Nocardioides zeae]